tara:strand:- start:52 stop:807 length:756 start_codon:yes stop_codon:yes gene_type:complete
MAEVYDYTLYYEEIIDDLPTYVSDTSLYINNFIDSWVSEKVLINQALKNIDENSQELENKISSYRNSLLIYEYQQRLIDQNFDTSIISDEIIRYYEDNIDKFKLDQDIFKGRYIIIDKNAPNLKSLYKLFRSKDDSDIDEMISYCMLYALEYYVNDSIWTTYNSIQQKFPKSVSPTSIFYSKRKYDIFEQDNFIYLLSIKDYKFKGNISPFSVVKQKIKSLIINRNKMRYLEVIENELIQNGKLSNNIKIY